MADLTQDFRFSLRQYRRSPAFSALAVFLIAIGMAATTQIFTLVDAFLLRPLPVRDPQNLVQLFTQQPKRPAEPYFDHGFYNQLSRYSPTLFKVVGQMDTARSMEREGHAERLHVVAVTEDFFSDLGITPRLGRAIAGGDNHVAVLSYVCWSRSFGSDPQVLGQVVRLQGHSFTVIGVTSQAFTGTTVDTSPDLWIPFVNQLDFSRTPNPVLDRYVIEIIARLRPGISVTQAQQETEASWNRYMQAWAPNDNYRGLIRGTLEVHSLAYGISPIRNQSRTALVLLLAGTGLLLLMVCANVGGLLLFRATERQRETAVRVALGASRLQILRQWFAESLLLTATGGCAGILIAHASMPALMRWLPPAHGIGLDPAEARALTLRPELDLRIVAFFAAVCLVTALLCALAPAWNSSRREITMALKSTISDRRTYLLQSALCGFQIALCTTLLLSAGLIIRSLSNLRASNSGIDFAHVTIFSIDPYVRGYDSQKTWALQQRLIKGVQSLPGAEGAALANRALMRGIGLGTSVVFPGQKNGGVINTSVNSVTPEYFGVMGIHFLAGRNFSQSDQLKENKVSGAIVNEAFVKKFLNGSNPLGEKFGTGKQFVKPDYEIIGVVNDTKYRSLREVPPPIYYTYSFGPTAYPEAFVLHVRSHGDPHAIIRPVRQLLKSIDPELPPYQVATLAEEVDRSLWQEQSLMALASCFGVFALLLSVSGVYGILAYFVAQRQPEIGLRMALGASSHHLAWLVCHRVFPMLLGGVLAGAALSWVTNRWMQSLLYGVQPFDPVTNIAVMLMLTTIGIGGAAAPAFRAMRVDPSSALRRN